MGLLFSSHNAPIPDRYYDDFVKDMPSQSGNTVAITGTTTGTGFEAAKAIVSRGGDVLCLNRPSERATSSLETLSKAAAEGGSATQVDCDLQDFASVRAAASTVKAKVKGSGLHALVNNAGVALLPEKATKDGFEVQMQTNHLSHFLLTSLLMPELEAAAAASGEARVVNHSSGGRNMAEMGKPAAAPLEAKYFEAMADGTDLGGDSDNARGKRYQQTKLANTVFTLALKDKLEMNGSKVKSVVAHPGSSFTSLISNTRKDGSGSMADNTLVLRLMRPLSQGAGDGSLPLLAATVSPEAESGDFFVPGVAGVLGWAFKDTMTGPPKKLDWEARADLEKYSLDKAMHTLLWECSEKATGVKLL